MNTDRGPTARLALFLARLFVGRQRAWGTMAALSEGLKLFAMSLIPGNMPLVIIAICSATGAKSGGSGSLKERLEGPHYFTNTPYPVRDPDPSLFKTLGSVSLSDMALLSAFSTSGFAFGNICARPAALHVPTVAMAGSLGVTAGLFVAFQRSSGRLMGLVDPNGW